MENINASEQIAVSEKVEPIITCTHLTKKYLKCVALNDVSLALKPGRIIGLLGPNGSGKTTMIKLINGLLQPTQGEIRIQGMKPSPETKAVISYLPDRTCLPQWMCVNELLRFYSDFYSDFDAVKAKDMLSRLEIADNMKLKSMSKGTKEKVQLIMAMSRAARVYILDEPIAGVDPAARDYILDTIITNYSKDACVIISTHLISDIEKILDEVVFIKDGSIVLQEDADCIREEHGESIDEYFREVFRC